MNIVQRDEQLSESPSLAERTIGAAIAHSEKWGTVWFGLFFLGSVLAAIGRAIWPDSSSVLVYVISMAVGFAAGILAHVRGGWL